MNELMHDILQMLWRQSWQLVLMVLIVWPIARLSQRRYPRFTYLLWLMVMIKSLLPFQFTIPNPTTLYLNTLPPITITELMVGGNEAFSVNLQFLLTLIWMGMVLVFLVKLIVNETRFLRTIKNAQELHIPQLTGLLAKLNITKPVRILRSNQVTVPQTLGLKNPVIIIPEAQFSRAPEDLLPLIAHELAHIKRRDLLAISTQTVFTILFFFHPLVHYVNRWMDLNRERICDEMAMEALDLNPKYYGRELLAHLEASLRPHPEIIVSGGMFMTKKNILKRFEYLMDGKGGIMLRIKNGQKLIIGALLIVMAVLACSEGEAPDLNASNPVANPEINKSTVKENKAYDVPPEPIGGFAAIQSAVVYPKLAREAGIEGTIIIQVVVNTDGTVSQGEILRGLPDTGLDEAALKSIQEVKWQPATKAGKSVPVKIAIPIVFKLAEK